MSEQRVLITQGQFATSSDPDVVITTLLGSCVACCLWDTAVGVGGMNHMLLAKGTSGDQVRTLSGIQAMEVLINDLLKQGAQRSRLQAKAFGGARMVRGLSEIGQENIDFTQNFLDQEGIPLVTASFGGTQARSLRFWPATGRALQKITDSEVKIIETAPPSAPRPSVELF